MSSSTAAGLPVSSIVVDLRAILSEKELADVVLESAIDKSRTPAVRAILAARSPVFRKMLFGGFAEANKGTVCLSDVRGCTIECIVEYCYTDDVELLRRGEKTKDIVFLAVAADYYGLSELAKRCSQTLQTVTISSPAQACIALEATNGLASAKAIVDHCFSVIRTRASSALLGQVDGRAGVTFLSRATLEQLLSDKLIVASEIILLQAALLWFQDQGPLGKRIHAGHDTSMQVEDAKSLSCLIDLSAIPPLQLRDLVEPSGLFTTEQLGAAYRTHALASAVSDNVSFFRPRCGIPGWESSPEEVLFSEGRESHGVELLNIKLVWGFSYKWVLQVVNNCNYFWTGVASGEVDKSGWLGKQAGGWVFGNHGSANHATFQDDGPYNEQGIKFDTGSALNLCLDLSDRSAGGVFSINDKQVFTGMRAGVAEATFQPAVSLRQPGSVRIVEFLVKGQEAVSECCVVSCF